MFLYQVLHATENGLETLRQSLDSLTRVSGTVAEALQ